MAAFTAREEGTLSVRKGELVEVIDTTRNEWTLIRTVDREPREGWIPSDFIKRYNYMEPYGKWAHLRERKPQTTWTISSIYLYTTANYWRSVSKTCILKCDTR